MVNYKVINVNVSIPHQYPVLPINKEEVEPYAYVVRNVLSMYEYFEIWV